MELLYLEMVFENERERKSEHKLDAQMSLTVYLRNECWSTARVGVQITD